MPWNAHDAGARAFHRHLVLRLCDLGSVEHVSCLSAAMACALLRDDDLPGHVLACWWIGCKFEECHDEFPFDVSELLPLAGISMAELVQLEAHVLRRQAFRMPRTTLVHEFRELCLAQGLRPEVAHYWAYLLLDAGDEAGLCTAAGWLDRFLALGASPARDDAMSRVRAAAQPELWERMVKRMALRPRMKREREA